MNKKVMHAFIGLLWTFLVAFALVKVLCPHWLIAQIEHENILSIGHYIDSHLPVKLMMDAVIGLLTFHFYLCSCKQVWKLTIKQYLILSGYCLCMVLCYLWNPTIGMILDLSALIAFPTMLNSSPKQYIPIFILHQGGQALMLFIRSAPLYLVDTNSATRFLLVLDVYIWLLIYYLYSNMYKEETLWAFLVSRFLAICRKLKLKRNSKK